MNVRRRVGQASPSDSSQFVDESGSGDIFSVTVVHDWNNQPTGTLEERVLALMPTVDIHHTDSHGSDIITGTATTVFASLTHQTTIADNAGAEAWNTERHAFTLRTTITITRNNAGGTVSGIDALMVTLMMSEIHRSDK